MENFTYSNIFDTKGIEYIAIIIFLALLIPFWIFLNKKAQITTRIKRALGFLTESILKVPQGVFHSKNHTWAFLEKNGEAIVGMDDLLTHLTGKVKIVPLKTVGQTVNKGEWIAEIRQNGKLLQISSPISGKVLGSNQFIESNPEVVNEDPFGDGWLYKIKPSAWKAETHTYFLAEEATEWTKTELARFKDFLAESTSKYAPEEAQLVLQDGGELRDNTLAELPNEIWNDFQKDFLNA
jgi:glycine cleavage system H protein